MKTLHLFDTFFEVMLSKYTCYGQLEHTYPLRFIKNDEENLY